MHRVQENWCVARRPGHRLYLSKRRGAPTFQALGPTVLFFQDSEFEQELFKLGVNPSDVTKTPARLDMVLGS